MLLYKGQVIKLVNIRQTLSASQLQLSRSRAAKQAIVQARKEAHTRVLAKSLAKKAPIAPPKPLSISKASNPTQKRKHSMVTGVESEGESRRVAKVAKIINSRGRAIILPQWLRE